MSETATAAAPAPAKVTKAAKTPKTGIEAAQKARAERKSSAQNDRFVFIPEKERTPEQMADQKQSPQEKCICTVLAEAKKTGYTRAELVEKLKGVLVTRQPEGRILSYYEKDLIKQGFVRVTVAAPAKEKVAKTAEE